MYMPRNHRFTIYDAMEAKGVFAQNSANIDSRDQEGLSAYKGPVEYPKMMYHPRGEERIITPSRVEPSPVGPQIIPAVREIIWQTVESKEQEDKLRGDGWHDHPAYAVEASGKPRPAMGSSQRVKDLEGELKAKEQELEHYKKLVAEDAERRQTDAAVKAQSGLKGLGAKVLQQ